MLWFGSGITPISDCDFRIGADCSMLARVNGNFVSSHKQYYATLGVFRAHGSAHSMRTQAHTRRNLARSYIVGMGAHTFFELSDRFERPTVRRQVCQVSCRTNEFGVITTGERLLSDNLIFRPCKAVGRVSSRQDARRRASAWSDAEQTPNRRRTDAEQESSELPVFKEEYQGHFLDAPNRRRTHAERTPNARRTDAEHILEEVINNKK